MVIHEHDIITLEMANDTNLIGRTVFGFDDSQYEDWQENRDMNFVPILSGIIRDFLPDEERIVLKLFGRHPNISWNCDLFEQIDGEYVFGSDNDSGFLVLGPVTTLKSKRKKWLPLTSDVVQIGLEVRTNRNISWPWEGYISELGGSTTYVVPTYVKRNPWNNGVPPGGRIQIYKQYGIDRYESDRARIFYNVYSIPKRRKFQCAMCSKPDANYRKGLCKSCSNKPF